MGKDNEMKTVLSSLAGLATWRKLAQRFNAGSQGLNRLESRQGRKKGDLFYLANRSRRFT
jgi:hypothetical protein